VAKKCYVSMPFGKKPAENGAIIDFELVYAELALLWQILSGTGFPNHFFCDSWVIGFWRDRPWLARRWIGRKSFDGEPGAEGPHWLPRCRLPPRVIGLASLPTPLAPKVGVGSSILC
jgi:hypothetical protein